MVKTAVEVHDILQKYGFNVSVVNMCFLKPFDKELVLEVASSHSLIVTMEEGVVTGGFGQAIMEWLSNQSYSSVKVCCVGLPDKFLEHGSVDVLKEKYGISAGRIVERILGIVNQSEKV